MYLVYIRTLMFVYLLPSVLKILQVIDLQTSQFPDWHIEIASDWDTLSGWVSLQGIIRAETLGLQDRVSVQRLKKYEG